MMTPEGWYTAMFCALVAEGMPLPMAQRTANAWAMRGRDYQVDNIEAYAHLIKRHVMNWREEFEPVHVMRRKSQEGIWRTVIWNDPGEGWIPESRFFKCEADAVMHQTEAMIAGGEALKRLQAIVAGQATDYVRGEQ